MAGCFDRCTHYDQSLPVQSQLLYAYTRLSAIFSAILQQHERLPRLLITISTTTYSILLLVVKCECHYSFGCWSCRHRPPFPISFSSSLPSSFLTPVGFLELLGTFAVATNHLMSIKTGALSPLKSFVSGRVLRCHHLHKR